VGKVDVPALRGVDLDVEKGHFLSIIGPSGSGKSTLFHIIGGLTPPTSGSVVVDGKDLSAMTDAARTRMRKRTVGFVFQKFNLLPNLTARDNIAVARYIGGTDAKPEPEFEEVLRLLGIGDRLDHKPNALSGGEQQRVAIARALVSDPTIMVCDEPTGDLDRQTANGIMELLRLLHQRGKTVIMVTHDAMAAAYAAHVLHMDKGVLVEAVAGSAVP
jgi:putative ABC transport system ATP-binding protein